MYNMKKRKILAMKKLESYMIDGARFRKILSKRKVLVIIIFTFH